MVGERWKETVRARDKRIKKRRGVRTDEQIDRKMGKRRVGGGGWMKKKKDP